MHLCRTKTIASMLQANMENNIFKLNIKNDKHQFNPKLSFLMLSTNYIYINDCFPFLGTETCLHLAVPQTVSRSASLRLKIKFDKYPDYVVVSESTVEIEDDSLITFVETDKPTYKPGQDVKIRILMLMRDLKPSQKSVRNYFVSNFSLDFYCLPAVIVSSLLWICFEIFVARRFQKYGSKIHR